MIKKNKCTRKNCTICHMKPLFNEAKKKLSAKSYELLNELWCCYEVEEMDAVYYKEKLDKLRAAKAN